ILFYRQEIDFATLLGQSSHRRKNGAMRILEEVFCADGGDDAIEGVWVGENRAEDGALRIGRLRHRPVEGDVQLCDSHLGDAHLYGGNLLETAIARFPAARSTTFPQTPARRMRRLSAFRRISAVRVATGKFSLTWK